VNTLLQHNGTMEAHQSQQPLTREDTWKDIRPRLATIVATKPSAEKEDTQGVPHGGVQKEIGKKVGWKEVRRHMRQPTQQLNLKDKKVSQGGMQKEMGRRRDARR